MVATPRRILRPEHSVYLLVHVLLFMGGLLIALIGSPIWIAVGTSVSATGVCGWVVYFWIRVNETSQGQLDRIRKVGVSDAFPARSVPIRPVLQDRFNSAKKSIDFMGFGLRALREDFGPDFDRWLRSIKIRILLLDPDAPTPDKSYAAQRDLEEGNGVGSIRNDIHQFLIFLASLKQRHPDNLDVRLYSCIPALNVCRIDGEIFWGPYVLGIQSRNTPTFVASAASGVMFDILRGHYDTAFSDKHSRNGLVLCEGKYVPAITD
jgi:hypothetical protein